MEAKATEPSDKPKNPIPSHGVPVPDKTGQPSEVINLENVVHETIHASNELEKEPLSMILIQPKNLETSGLDEASGGKVQHEESSSSSPTVDDSQQRNDPIAEDTAIIGSKDLSDEKDDGSGLRASHDVSDAPSRKSSVHALDARSKKKKTMGKRITDTLAAIGFKKKNSKKEQKTEEDNASTKNKSVKSKKGLKNDDNSSDFSQDASSPGQYWQSEDPAVKTVINLEEHMKNEKNLTGLQECIVDSTTEETSTPSTDPETKVENPQEKEDSVSTALQETICPIETATVADAVIASKSFQSTVIAQEENPPMTSGTLGEIIIDPPSRQRAETIDLSSDSVKEILSNVIDVTMKTTPENSNPVKDGVSGHTFTQEREDELIESLISKHISAGMTASIIHGVNLLEIFHADGAQKNDDVTAAAKLEQKSTESVDEPGRNVEGKSSSNMEYMQDDHCFDSQRPSSTTFLHDRPQSNKSNEELVNPSETEKIGNSIDNKEMDGVKTEDTNRNQ